MSDRKFPTSVLLEAMGPPFNAETLKDWRKRGLLPFLPEGVRGRVSLFTHEEVEAAAIMAHLARNGFPLNDAMAEAERIIKRPRAFAPYLFIIRDPETSDGDRIPVRDQEELDRLVEEAKANDQTYALVNFVGIKRRVAKIEADYLAANPEL